MTAWRRLTRDAPEANPFFAPAILGAALEHLAPPAVSLAVAEDASGRLLALAPVGPARLGRLVPAVSVYTHLYGPLGTPLLDPADPAAALARLVAVMDGGQPGGRILLFPDLPIDGAAGLALHSLAARTGRPLAVIGGHARAVLRPRAMEEGVRAVLPAKTRKELARQLRRLGDLGPLDWRSATMPRERADLLDAFLALEAAGWKGRRRTALRDRADALAFTCAVFESAAAGEARLDALMIAGRAVAMLASFRAGETVVTWKIAHDEALGRFSPGVQVMLQASEIFEADPTVALVDSLASASHPMVDRLWPGRQAIGLAALGPVGGGAAFRAGVLLAQGEVRARAELRALIRRARRSGRAKEDTS
jgi:CelD/BcsL family acetyltransferase involved in cellulose biosynthesis